MFGWVRSRLQEAYLRELKKSISGSPDHVAVIQDGNRRYAQEHGMDPSNGHVHGAETTENVLRWCQEVDIKEVTLYAFSTENFARPDDELESLFELLCDKLYTFADADLVHENNVQIRGLGEISRLPDRVVDAVRYAERRTDQYERLQLNIALAYGGRNELLQVARQIATDVDDGELAPSDITVAEIEERLYDEPVREVDLIIRTGGDERTSNFLPWYANGNEAAVYFCTPYWPEFSKRDFFRAIRTYESREESWQRSRVTRSLTLIQALADIEQNERKRVIERLRGQLPDAATAALDRSLRDKNIDAVRSTEQPSD